MVSRLIHNMLGLTVVDFIIIVALSLYVLTHIQEGFLILTRRLVSFIGGVVLAFIFYGYIAHLVVAHVSWTIGIVDAFSFLLLFIIFERLIKFALGTFFSFLPKELHYSRFSRVLAILPALVDGVILTSLFLLLLVIAPIFPSVKEPIESSRIGSSLVDGASNVEVYLDQVFGRATEETLGFLTIHPGENESIALPFKPFQTSIDAASEEKMLELVNAARAEDNLPPLAFDSKLQAVARAHSLDMWQNQYFSHTDPSGKDPFARMKDAGITFSTAGENIALARTVERAHEGLMNSPGHRRNILDPEFKKIGIGVIDGGVYGKMFTQDFTD